LTLASEETQTKSCFANEPVYGAVKMEERTARIEAALKTIGWEEGGLEPLEKIGKTAEKG